MITITSTELLEQTENWGWILFYSPGSPPVITPPGSEELGYKVAYEAVLYANVAIRWTWDDRMVIVKNRYGEINCRPDETHISPQPTPEDYAADE